jgi:hypothetical protein
LNDADPAVKLSGARVLSSWNSMGLEIPNMKSNCAALAAVLNRIEVAASVAAATTDLSFI